MAVERLFEVAAEGRYGQVILDTPPTRQALDFLEAPAAHRGLPRQRRPAGGAQALVRRGGAAPGRLASGVPSAGGRSASSTRSWGSTCCATWRSSSRPSGRSTRASASGRRRWSSSCARPKTRFVLVAGPGEERIPDTLFFARRLEQAGYHLGPDRGEPGPSALPGRRSAAASRTIPAVRPAGSCCPGWESATARASSSWPSSSPASSR